MSTSTSTSVVTVPTLSDLTEWKAESDKHSEALKAVRACKSFAEFQQALPVARTLLRDSDAAVAAVEQAKAIAKVGQEVADAHTSYRIGLTAQYLRWLPKVTNRDLARDLWDADESEIVRREKMVARDRKALAIIAAAKEGRASAPEGSSISVPSPASALKMVKHATVADTKAMVARAKAGEPIVPQTTDTPAPVKIGRAVSAAAALVDMLGNVDPESITPDAVSALLASLSKATTRAQSLTPKA